MPTTLSDPNAVFFFVKTPRGFHVGDALPCKCFKILLLDRMDHGAVLSFRLPQKGFHAKTVRSYAMRAGIGLFDGFDQIFIACSLEQFSMKRHVALEDYF